MNLFIINLKIKLQYSTSKQLDFFKYINSKINVQHLKNNSLLSSKMKLNVKLYKT